MELYEIRILRTDQTPLTNFEQHYLNDEAAIRSARYFAEDRPFQVWRRSQCVLSVQKPPVAESRSAAS
jgi:hypothetical protein